MLNTINTTSTPLSQTYSGVTSTESVDSDAASTATEQAAAASNDDDISLSTRAQKFSAIDNEFFRGDSLTSADIKTLVVRLHEYGLITSTEYSMLKGEDDTASETDADAVSEMMTQTLISYIDDLEQSLSVRDETDTFGSVGIDELQSALGSARTIINDVASAKTKSDFKQTVNENNKTLMDVVASPEFSTMSTDEQATLNEIVKTLTVIDKLSLDQITNSSVSKYVAISKL